MSIVQAQGQAKCISIEATIVRADGTVEPLGVIKYEHRSRWAALWFRLTKPFRKPTMGIDSVQVQAILADQHDWRVSGAEAAGMSFTDYLATRKD